MSQISSSISSWARRLASALIILAFAGCGFQLRGQDLMNSGYVYAVSGDGKDSGLGVELTRRLSEWNVLDEDAPDLMVDLIDVRRQQVDGAVSAEAMLLEQAVRIEVRYQVVDANGNEIQSARSISRQRHFRLDRSNLLATAAVKEDVAELLERELAAQLLRSLNLIQQTQVSVLAR